MPPGSTAGISLLVFHFHRLFHAAKYVLLAEKFNLSRPLILAMGSEGASRRPFCLNCSKPVRTCLCSRLPSPLDNSIGVTILQHSLEKKHPLNSTRVAKLGLKNLEVVPVTDVNFHAQLYVRPLQHCLVCREKLEAEERLDFSASRVDDLRQGVANQDNDAQCGSGCSSAHSNKIQRSDSGHPRGCPMDTDDLITITSDKCTIICSGSDIKMFVERSAKPKIDRILETPIGKAAISNGFVVKKLQRKELQPTKEFLDFEEFEIMVPPGTALLFPSDKAISLKAVDFEVRHLVVLDGTWAKAKRIYYENPWLQLLPHLKLDLGNVSLYGEVRHQPKAGCLSTIESIICTMKELRSDMEGLDKLLDVFESMIGDQRLCKDEKFRGMSLK